MAATAYRTAPDPAQTGWPPGIRYIIGNEGCERFSYYGMRAILYIYVVGLYIGLRDLDEDAAKKAATATTHYFFAAVYALPLIGAIIADRLLGKYRTILYLSVVYCLGHLALAVFEDPAWQQQLLGRVWVDPVQGLYLGLALIAVGSGGIKPCVSANVGDQFGPGNWHLLQKVFNAFYFIINFGSAFATILIPLVRGDLVVDPATGHYTYTGHVGWAFGIPGLLMGLATIIFWAGRRDFVHVPPRPGGLLGLLDVASGSALFMVIGWPIFFADLTPLWGTVAVSAACLAAFVALFAWRQRLEPDDGFLALTFYAVRARLAGLDPGPGAPPPEGARDLRDHWLYGPAARRFGSPVAEGPVAVWKVISVFILISVFWALFDQHSSTWIAQAKEMDRVLDFSPVGWMGIVGLLGFVVGAAVVVGAAWSPARKLGGLVVGAAAGLVAGYLLALAQPAGGFELQPSQVPATNPFMVMVLIPLTTFGLYPLMARLGFEPRPLRRMTLGMVVAALSFVAVAFIQMRIEALAPTGGKVHIGWQLIPYFVITLAEVMVSVTGLEFAYSQAPRRMKSVIMGFWLFTVTLGNLLVAFLAGLEDLPLVAFFWVFAGLMGVAAVLFGIRAAFYTYRDYTQ